MSLEPGSVPIRPRGAKLRPAGGGPSPQGGASKEAQSGACAPPQGRPTRAPPISRDPSRPLPTPHTLTRVGGPTGPRRWPSLHTAETTALTTHVVSLRPLILQHMPCRRRPGTVAAWKHQITRWHARVSSRDGVPGALLQEICGGTGGMVKRCVQAHLCSMSNTPTWLGTPELRPDARTRYTNLFTGRYHFTFVSAARRALSQSSESSPQTACSEGEWWQG